MNRNDDDVARAIAGHLDRSLDSIGQPQVDRLRAARMAALDAYAAKPAAAWGFAWLGAGVGRLGGFRWTAWRLLLPMTALLLGLAGTGAVYWQNLTRQANELAEIDAGLLSDDLPINAYLDNGLDSWLKRPHQ